MMLRIGNKNREAGFMLIEVMIAASILSLGTVMISQSNMMSMDVYGRYVNRLSIQNWAEEKIWEIKQAMLESEVPNVGQTSGEVAQNNKTYNWYLAVQSTTSASKFFDLYTIQLSISWPEGSRSASLTRSSYLLKLKIAKT